MVNTAREQLFQLCFKDIQRLARDAMQQAADDFVVFALDLRDDAAQAVADYFTKGTGVDPADTIRGAQESGIPTMVAAVRKEAALAILRTTKALFAETIEKKKIPEGVFWVSIFAGKGQSLAAVPLEPLAG